MIELLLMGLAGAGALAGYAKTRQFVRDRLQFVDAVHRRSAPYVAGGLAAVAAAPVAWLLPVIGGGSAVLFGAAVGWGVVKGRRDIARLPPGRPAP